MTHHLRPALVILGLLSALTGVLYPLAVTGIAQALFGSLANGSLVAEAGGPVGSRMIGQPFSSPRYFWSRASATAAQPYNGAASSGSNLGPTNPALVDAVQERITALRAADPDAGPVVPIDLVTASGSGLDPHISAAAARYQVTRVARARHLPAAVVEALVAQHTDGPQWGLLGEARVNVLLLNRALDLAGRP